MNTTTYKERMNLSEDALFEEGATQNDMTDEELKIESLKIATNIAKLMSNVTTEDIVNIAETVAKFIKGEDTTMNLETDDDSDDADTEETDTEEEEETTTDNEEDFTVEDETDADGKTENESEKTDEALEDFEI